MEFSVRVVHTLGCSDADEGASLGCAESYFFFATFWGTKRRKIIRVILVESRSRDNAMVSSKSGGSVASPARIRSAHNLRACEKDSSLIAMTICYSIRATHVVHVYSHL
jgi:hypothetical protein